MLYVLRILKGKKYHQIKRLQEVRILAFRLLVQQIKSL